MDYSTCITLPQPDDRPESFVFSVHKAGSSLLFGMLADTCNDCHISAISIPDLLFLDGVLERDWHTDIRYLSLFQRGYLYFGFRMFPPILGHYDKLRRSRKVLLVRDPRDMLVSQYYSFGGKHFSHKMPNKDAARFIAEHKTNEHLGIDDYVISQSEYLHNKLFHYRENIFDQELLIVKYEEMFWDKIKYLRNTLDHVGVSVSDTHAIKVATEFDIRPLTESPQNHIRRAYPGDHRNKLKDSTNERLANMFRGIMRDFGYNL